MYRSGSNFEFVEKHVPKWYVPKWSCTDLALTLINVVRCWTAGPIDVHSTTMPLHGPVESAGDYATTWGLVLMLSAYARTQEPPSTAERQRLFAFVRTNKRTNQQTNTHDDKPVGD